MDSMKTETAIESARLKFVCLCKEVGSDSISEENAILSVGREFLPPCAIAVLDNRNASSVEYYEWLSSQTMAAQDQHDRDVDAGHEWHDE
jgi:hypothetical protein